MSQSICDILNDNAAYSFALPQSNNDNSDS